MIAPLHRHQASAPLIALLSFVLSGFAACAQAPSAPQSNAQSNEPTTTPRLHDPSTIVRDGELYYIYSTGKGMPFFSSPDAHIWTRRGAVFARLPEEVVAAAPGNNGLDVWAPDILRVGNTFYLYYAVSKWGSFASAVALATNTTLNPDDPKYKWIDRGVVVKSDGVEDLNAIDPGAVMAPDGTLWLCYGSYHGSIDVVELDAKTGQRMHPDSPVSIVARRSEASDIMAHDGWFYLFVNHGSCCKGKDSEYHINVGRSRLVTGPYLDRAGKPLTEVAGEPFLATEGEHIGPGHFGLLPGKPERFSIHYEADPAAGGKSALAIRLLRWSNDGWPEAGPIE